MIIDGHQTFGVDEVIDRAHREWTHDLPKARRRAAAGALCRAVESRQDEDELGFFFVSPAIIAAAAALTDAVPGFLSDLLGGIGPRTVVAPPAPPPPPQCNWWQKFTKYFGARPNCR